MSGSASRTLVERFSGTLERTGVLGIIGPNGAGKSTLLKALLGEHPTLGGELRLGASITVGYYRQDLSQVPLKKAVYDVIADMRPLWERGRIQGHLGRFGFSGKEVLRRADTLSGGERARLALAILMLSRANLLVLDEPTNHLDVESIEALEDAIQEYDGTVILVSHDRELLRALTTRHLGPARAADDRVRRRVRRVGGSEHGARARRGGTRRRGSGAAAGP